MSSSDNPQSDTLFDEIDLGFDKTEANTLLDLRERFDILPVGGKLAVAEAFIRLDGDFDSEALQARKGEELDKAAEAARSAESKCGLCDREFEEGDVILERQSVWVTPGTNQVQMRDDLGERAHGSCVKRVKEGGSAEPGLF